MGKVIDMLVAPFKTSAQNQTFSQEQIAGWQNLIMQQQEQLWAREDSAYQRMVADMQKAGLNPWTGISSGGSPAAAATPASEALNFTMQMLSSNRDWQKVMFKGVDTYSQALNRTANIFDRIVSWFNDAFSKVFN